MPAVKADPAVLLAWVRLILETSVLPDWSWNLLPRAISTLVAGVEAAAALGLFSVACVTKTTRAGGRSGRWP